jgi:predicted nucleotidyltransferase
MVIEETLRAKRGDVLRLAASRGVRNLRIFGSVARGEAGPESDVDFLAEFGPGTTLLVHAAFERELAALLGCKVHVVSERGLRPRVRERVMREAIPV